MTRTVCGFLSNRVFSRRVVYVTYGTHAVSWQFLYPRSVSCWIRSADHLGKGNTVYSLCPVTNWEKQKESCREVWMWELPEHRNKICSKVCGARKQSSFSACPGEHHPSDMRPQYMGDTVQCFRTSWNHNALSETMYHTHVHQNGHSPASHSDSERESFHDFLCSTIRYPFSGGNVSI